MSPRVPRGQALVMLCLTMLLLTLMVCITLSFSTRVREKMETQSVADMAAYSSAVATARTFNSIALIRRAETAHLVAMTATMSLMSWTSMIRADLNATRVAAAGCPAAATALDSLNEANTTIQDKWNELDAKAGVQTLNIQILAFYLAYTQGKLFERLQKAVDGGPDSFSTQLTKLASQGSLYPTELRAGPTPVSVTELIQATGGEDFGMDVALASRGYGFITQRQGPSDAVATGGILGALGDAGGSITTVNGGGSAYWGNALDHGGNATDYTYFLFAEDHAQVQVTFPGCAPFTVTARAGVRSTDQNDTTDDHWWYPATPVLGNADPGIEKQYRHTLLPCDDPKYCPNVFVAGLAYNTTDHSDDNLWAQPKLYSLVQRHYKDRTGLDDPWNLHFNFVFSSSPSGYDTRGLTTGGGTDISVQSALATGLAYYHRRGHWNEPPNLWNPFWRATLVAADVDASGDPRRMGTDIPTTVGAPGAAAFNQLVLAGFKGIH